MKTKKVVIHGILEIQMTKKVVTIRHLHEPNNIIATKEIIKGSEFTIQHEVLNGSLFRHIKPNNLGLKEILELKGTKLVVTNNNCLLLYKNGIPSIVGFPSEYIELSGMYLNEDGNRMIPKVSILPKEKLRSMWPIVQQASFYNKYNEEFSKDVEILTPKLKRYATSKPLTKVLGIHKSRFVHIYNNFTGSARFVKEMNEIVCDLAKPMMVEEFADKIRVYHETWVKGRHFKYTSEGVIINESIMGLNTLIIKNGFSGHINISKLGLNVEQFEDFPVNDKGFIVISRHKHTSLELTATGKVIVYEYGVPSVKGYPASFNTITGPYLQFGKITYPQSTMFNSTEIKTFEKELIKESFFYDERFHYESFETSLPHTKDSLDINKERTLTDLFFKEHPKAPSYISKKLTDVYGDLIIHTVGLDNIYYSNTI